MDQTNNGSKPDSELVAQTRWQKIRPWIIPNITAGGPKGTLKRLAFRLVFWYLVIVIMLGFLQRSLIYYPYKQSVISPADAGLPAGRVHSIATTTSDGIELNGWHILPVGHTARNQNECRQELSSGRPVVLFFSGNGANRRYRMTEFGIFSSLGANVFIFDYRGYGENSGSPTEEGLRIDAHAAWKHLTEEFDVSPNRVILYGESLGGGVAVRLAADVCEAGTPPAALVLRSTFSSITDTAQHHYPWLPVRLILIDRFESAHHIQHVTCPILHVHGTRDTIVPVELGRKLFLSAPLVSTAGIAKQFVELKKADHNDVLLVTAAEFRQAIGEFFKLIQVEREN